MNTKYEKYLPLQIRQQSRWAEEDEILCSEGAKTINIHDTFTKAGIPLTSDSRYLCVDTSDGHSLIYGSSGSKKTRLLILPTVNVLLRAGESLIITDPKGEIYERTSGLAQKNGYRTLALNFRDMNMNRWNPLAEAYKLYKDKKTREDGITLLSEFLFLITQPDEKKSISNDPFWNSTSLSLATALGLILFESAETENDVTIANFLNLCSSFGTEDEKYLHYILSKIPQESLAAINLRSILNSAEKTRQSIQVSLFSFLTKYITNTKLLRMLSASDFTFEELAAQKFALYLILPDEKNTYNELISEFIKQSYQAFISYAQKEYGNLKTRLNYVLDEFANIGKIPDMANMLAASRSRNIRFILVVQTNLKIYGDDAEIITANCNNLYFITSRDLNLLNNMSQLCGTAYDGNPLISVSQLQRFSKEKGEILILHGREYPYISTFPDIDDYAFEQYPALSIITRNTKKRDALTLKDIVETHQENIKNWFKEETL